MSQYKNLLEVKKLRIFQKENNVNGKFIAISKPIKTSIFSIDECCFNGKFRFVKELRKYDGFNEHCK